MPKHMLNVNSSISLMLMSLSSKIILKYLDNIHVLDIILIAVLINIIVSRGSWALMKQLITSNRTHLMLPVYAYYCAKAPWSSRLFTRPTVYLKKLSQLWILNTCCFIWEGRVKIITNSLVYASGKWSFDLVIVWLVNAFWGEKQHSITSIEYRYTCWSHNLSIC